MNENLTPFHCGSQAADWDAMNCEGCQHGDRYENDHEYPWGRCAIRDAITRAYFEPWDPRVSEAMGYDGGVYPPAICASREEAA